MRQLPPVSNSVLLAPMHLTQPCNACPATSLGANGALQQHSAYSANQEPTPFTSATKVLASQLALRHTSLPPTPISALLAIPPAFSVLQHQTAQLAQLATISLRVHGLV